MIPLFDMPALLEIEELPIRVNTRGKWLHGDEPLHPKVEVLFRKSVRMNPDGTYRIEVGRNKSAVHVEDAAFLVMGLTIAEDDSGGISRVELRLSDGVCEALNPATLMQSEADVFYCRIVRDGFWVPCRFPPGAYHNLMLHAQLIESQIALVIGGKSFGVAQYVQAPEAVT